MGPNLLYPATEIYVNKYFLSMYMYMYMYIEILDIEFRASHLQSMQSIIELHTQPLYWRERYQKF